MTFLYGFKVRKQKETKRQKHFRGDKENFPNRKMMEAISDCKQRECDNLKKKNWLHNTLA